MGYFWLPDKPDTKLPGTLSISDGGIIKLELVPTRGNAKLVLGERFERIVGEIEKEEFVTLDYCRFKKGEHLGGISKIRYNVERAFTGITYKDNENPSFKSVSFSVEGLDDWVGLNEVTIDHLPRGEGSIALSYKQPEHVATNLDNGMRLSIVSTLACLGRFSINADYTLRQKVDEFNIRPITLFTLFSPDVHELDDYIPVVKELTAFLCFAANRLVCIDSMSAEICNPSADTKAEKTQLDTVKMYYESGPYSKDKPKTPRPNPIEFSVLTEHIERILTKWRTVFIQIEPALNLYLLAVTGAHPTPQGRFLALAQALEACHRRMNSGKDSFGERIRKIIEPYTEVIGGEESRKELAAKIANTRTYFTHYIRNREAKAAKGVELRHLCSKMECIFQLYILQLLDFNKPHPSLDRILASEFFTPESQEPS